jgi:1-acyl-sn-glycerol-3-phosphate acyltransferase
MRKWRYEPARDLDQPFIERLRHFPREPDMLVYGVRSLAALACRGWLRTYHRLSIAGREHLPSDGSFVLVANHASHLDTLCLLAALRMRQLHRAFPAAARDYFFVRAPRVAAAAILVNALPFEREIHVRQSLELCRHLLANPGNVLILFPEGTRSHDGMIGEFRPGIGWLLAGTTIPVLPCRLEGCYRALPKGAWWPRPYRLRLTIGGQRTYPEADPRTVAEDLRNVIVGLEVEDAAH